MNQKPTRALVNERQFPVRLTVLVHGDPTDLPNRLTSTWLRTHIKTGGYRVSRGETWSGRKVAHIYLVSVFDAWALLLGCPHLQLHGEAYTGPVNDGLGAGGGPDSYNV